MAKTGEKANKEYQRIIELPCPICGEEMRWTRYANKNVMVKACVKCDKMFDRRNNEYKGVDNDT